MKALFFVVALALVAAVLADDEYTVKPCTITKECVWTVDVEIKTLFTYSRTKYWLNKNTIRKTDYNYRGVIISDTIYRPDLAITEKIGDTDVSFVNVWSYDTSGCSNSTSLDLEMDTYKEKGPLYYLFGKTDTPADYLYYLTHDTVFTNKTTAEFDDGDEYDTYFNDDIDYEAVFVDADGNIVGIVKHNDIPDERTAYFFKYDNRFAPEDMIFDEDFVYNCTSNLIFEEPEVKDSFMCSATATKAALAIVLLSALIALF